MSKYVRICSMFLALVMLFNLVPLQAFAAADAIDTATSDSAVSKVPAAESVSAATVVQEIEENRTEYSKEFKLSNGLNMAVVYGAPVHYEQDGQWAEIDNTLKAADGVYTNTAGVWEVALPQNFNMNSPVSITKDGYTLSFTLAGQLTAPAGTATKAVAKEQTLSVTTAQTATAQLRDFGVAAAKAEAEHPETVNEKLRSGLVYEDVFAGTAITYDLDSNKVKESVILEEYNATLRGYKYTLNVGSLVPVLTDAGQIDFYNKEKTNVVMTMPAPFLVDAANTYNYDVQVQLTGTGSTYTLTYLLPQSWLADSSRQWPVVLDPVVVPELTTSNIRDRLVTENTVYPYNGQVLEAGRGTNDGIERFYVKYKDLPALSPSDVIVDAKIMLKVCGGYNAPKVEVHKVLDIWESETISWSNKPDYDVTVEDYSVLASNSQWHQWTITDIVRGWYEGQNTGMMFKASDEVENGTSSQWRQYVSSDGGGSSDRPTMTIIFRNNNGLEGYWNYTAASAGRAGTGYVNDYTGNLVWTSGDLGFGGNRAPVAISHVYNANDTVITNTSNNSMTTGGNGFNMGYGWRTNYNQVVYGWSIDRSYYVWEDSDGTDHYFYKKGTTGKYLDEDGLELTLTVKSNGYTITDKGGNTSYFDTQGRLYKAENNQQTKSAVQIYYTTDTGKEIDYILDGVNRKYDFTYNENGMLSRIGYYGTGDAELFCVSYSYDENNDLVSVTDKDGKTSYYTYTNHLLISAQDIDGYKLSYTYTKTEAGKPSRIASITESHNEKTGSRLTVSYAHNQTTFTDHNGNKQICQFNDFGNTVSVQDGLGRAQHAQYANMSMSDAGKGNQLKLSSKLQNTVKNYFIDSGFEGQSTGGGTVSFVSDVVYMGNKALKTTTTATKSAISLAAGESYTFSAWVKTEDTTAKLILGTAESTVLPANSDWTRLEVTYDNHSQSAVPITPGLVTGNDAGAAYMDCIQLEKAPTASRYNLVDNGDFSAGMTGWTGSDYTCTSNTSGAPQLDSNIVTVTGDPASEKQLSQTVNVSGAEGDCFVLAGWAKGDSVPLFNNRTFGIIGTFNYTDGTTGDFTASFNPDTRMTVGDEAVIAWQYTAAPMVAKKPYSSITVKLAYDYNANTVFFDGIQLFKEVYGCSYTYDDEGNIVKAEDLQQKETTYEYNDSGDLTKVILASGAEMTYTYDSYHNVLTSTSSEGLSYTFTYDTYGNNTKVSTTSDSLTMSAEAGYTADGNYQTSAKDALDNEITYGYNTQTGVLEWVQGPTDTAATRTNYTYDEMYRTATVSMTTDSGLAMSVAYTYEDDLLTAITTPTTTYSFGYGDFALRETVKIGSKTLATYTYTEQNKYLQSLDYGNGDSVQYLYDTYGRLLSETYEDGDVVTYQYDNDGALATVTDKASGITTRYYYDLTGRSVGYSETGTGLNHRVVYAYNSDNNLSQTVETIGTDEKVTSYSYDDDNRTTEITTDGTTVAYTYDGFGRVSQQVTKTTENGQEKILLTEVFTYHKPSENTTSARIESYKTYAGEIGDSNLRAEYHYTYDENGNITSVYNGTAWVYYTYDSQNQLIREDNQRTSRTYTWVYDNAGNILRFNTHAYTRAEVGEAITVEYGYDTKENEADEDYWGDLLISLDGQTVTYEYQQATEVLQEDGTTKTYYNIGNPTQLNGRTYTWEHGRRLATMTKGSVQWTYTYNNAGLRTSRSNGTTTYKYIYDGSLLKRMTITDSTGTKQVDFTYDAGGTPLTMTYQGSTYYYIVNLQGDVEGLLDADGNRVLTYYYTAYGQGKYLAGEHALTNTLININPLGYRGYIHDVGTGLYYCQSRYYDPAIGRFINADGLVATGQGLTGNNMFAYCGNNPTNRCDCSGDCWHNDSWWDLCDACEYVFDNILIGTVCAATGSPTLIAAGTTVATASPAIKEVHYDVREEKNVNLPKEYNEAENSDGADTKVNDAFHQFSAPNGDNDKVCWPDGREAVYDASGKLVTDPRDKGTYNFIYPDGFWGKLGHGIVDVFPYILWGNSEEDTTTMFERIAILF